MVSDVQKAALKSSWAGVDHKDCGVKFYNNMQSSCPDVYAVFNLGDDTAKVAVQGEKVMKLVNTAVTNIDDMGAVDKELDAAATRHTNYGAKKAHFPPAKSCFVAAVKASSSNWSGDCDGAWDAFYDLVAGKLTAHLS